MSSKRRKIIRTIFFGERVVSTMYLWHNYGKSTIGSKEDIERVSAENLKNFYVQYYQPDNATLMIGGNFDEAKTLAMVGKYFGPIPKPSRKLKPTYTVEPAQDGQRSVELRRNGRYSIPDAGLSYTGFFGLRQRSQRSYR